MKISYDPAKRATTLSERGLDFEDAATVFAGLQLTRLDERRDYGEDRYRLLGDQLVMVVWTERAGSRRIISMRTCHEDEEARSHPGPISHSKKGVVIRGKKGVVTGELLSRLRAEASAQLKQPTRGAWVDPDDAPEWTREQLEQADLYRGDKLIRRGRPPSGNPKLALKLRIDADVIEHFRATGPGWQTRINETLRRAAKLGR